MAEPTHIQVRGASAHNLQHVDVDVPRNALTVFTGVSGSGKSSLAFDTIYKEGQRRFMESLSAYARQFLGQMERPPVDSVEGVSPTLSIDQKTVNRNPRSTVGTITEIYDHLRLLYARLGTPHCPKCGTEVDRVSVDDIVDELLRVGAGERTQVLGAVVRERKGEYRREMEDLARDGWVRARVDGQMVRLDEPPELARYERHTIEVVVDRLVPSAADRARMAEAIETASGLGDGVVVVLIGERELVFSTERGCPHHPDVGIPELEPRLFSFNAPQGACPTCSGLGVLEGFDPTLLVDMGRTVPDAFLAFNDEGRLPFAHFDKAALVQVAKALGASPRRKLSGWSQDHLTRLLFGDRSVVYHTTKQRENGRVDEREWEWRGLLGLVQNIWRYTAYKGFERFRTRQACDGCEGRRLSAVSLAVSFRDRPITDFTAMTVGEAHRVFSELQLEPDEREVGALLVQEIGDRLAFLDDVGLAYLSLDRSANTLSGGEAQRIRLAAQVGSALQGVTYVLDEPSIGLHPRDNARLLRTLFSLRDRGNTVIVVEHDEETIRAADHVIEVGPGAGSEGGHVVASTTPGRFMRSKAITAAYLRGELSIPLPERRRAGNGRRLRLRGARRHNLRGVDLELPLGALTVVTGVSGSGKSTLIFGVLEQNLRDRLADPRAPLRDCDAFKGFEHVDKLIRISQSPIGRTPRSNPATYVGAFDPIRTLFAATPEARSRGYKKGRFSFNVQGGRCEACEGAGIKTVEMQFLPSVVVPCEVCQGRRFNDETLEITYKGRTISDMLVMTVAEAYDFFKAVPKLARILGTMVEVGLGYVPIGQPSTTLSGGEAQRVKLATELHRPQKGHTLYLLDEPTTGLHFHDVVNLLASLQGLVDSGHTVVVVEHHTDVIKCADHVIDLGPDGGSMGGRIIGVGTPEAVAIMHTPTGRALAALTELGALTGEAPPPPFITSQAPVIATAQHLRVVGARKHNLRDVSVDIPHGQMTVITGVSGSGKTSLAFDTLFAEGQRRYVESLSTYARRFLGRLERAPVERLEGLKPAIAIDQGTASRNPRSTVATVTEIHDVLRILYARVGLAHCPVCDRRVEGLAPSRAAKALASQATGSGWLLCRLRPFEQGEVRRNGLVRDGWTRLLDRSGAKPREVQLESPQAVALLVAGAELVVDRLNPARDTRSRVAEAIGHAYRLGGGLVTFQPRREGPAITLTERPTCPDHGPVHSDELTPRHFSFNSRIGACSTCEGLGRARRVVSEKLFPQPSEPFWQALDGRVSGILARSPRNRALVTAVYEVLDLPESTPFDALGSEQVDVLLDGLDVSLTLKWSRRWGRSKQTVEEARTWKGLRAILKGWSSELGWLTAERVCPDCGGGRLRPSLLAVRLGGMGIHQLMALTVDEALAAISALQLQGERAAIAGRALLELRRRLGFLVDVGLGYLALDRTAVTLSGGESQRIRLASQLGSQLTGVVYVLDEPTVGLHPRDTERLLQTLEGLRDQGNTLIVVEHDPDTILRADHIIDMGPGAGRHGGDVLAEGPPIAIAANPASVTGRWLAGVERLPTRAKRRSPRGHMTLSAAAVHNLVGVDVALPTGLWLAISGVSGSGKSSLIMDTLAPAIRRHMGQDALPADLGDFGTTEPIDRVVVVDQSPIGRSPRSTPATYCKVLDKLRALYAQTPGAKQRGWKPGRFSFNSKSGRCTHCEGRGATLVEMHFLPDVWVPCDSCAGKRYNRETLDVRFKGHSIADVLAMRCDEALEVFTNQRSIARQLKALVDVGLGYMALGQPANTLSGGEAQRVKLAAELTSRKGHCVYILDEPTTGLHMADVANLVQVLHALVDKGHTVITIEHHLGILLQADALVDMGPEGGDQGGRVVAQGTPEQVAASGSHTGQWLARELG